MCGQAGSPRAGLTASTDPSQVGRVRCSAPRCQLSPLASTIAPIPAKASVKAFGTTSSRTLNAVPASPRSSRPAGQPSIASTAPRDLIDGISAEWQAEMPDIATDELELTRRAGRLSALLQDSLGHCLTRWELTHSEYGVLITLRSAGPPYELRPSDVKARVLMTAGGISNAANRLEQRGLIERDDDPDDKRAAWLRLTLKGFDVAEQVIAAWAADLAALLRGVPPESVRAASNALRDVLIALGDREPLAPKTRQQAEPRG